MNVRLILLFLCIQGSCWSVAGQTPSPVLIEWQKDYLDLGGTDGTEIRQIADGGYILGGIVFGYSYGAPNYWALKLNSTGAVSWQGAFGGSNLEFMRKVLPLSDGGTVLVGTSDSFTDGNKTSPNLGSSDIWMVRLDASGNKLWDRSVGLSLAEQNASGCSTSDGGFLLGAQAIANSRRTDYFVYRVNSTGDVLWSRSFGGLTNDRLWSVQQTVDGGFILGGDSTSRIGGEKSAPNLGAYDYWLVRVDTNGNKIWDRTYGGTNNDVLQVVRQTQDGGFLLAGSSASGIGGNKTTPALGGSDWWIVRVDSSGNKLWDKTFGDSGDEDISGVEVLSDGGFLIVGTSTSGSGANKDAPSWGGHDVWLVRIDSQGNRLWDFSLGGNDRDFGRSVQQTADGGFIVCAASVSGISGNKTTTASIFGNIWVIKLSPERPHLRWEPCCFEDVGPQWSLLLHGVSNLTYRTETSTNLVNWNPIRTNQVAGNDVEILKGNLSLQSKRFYRAVQIPTP